jgi:hypothetical protein
MSAYISRLSILIVLMGITLKSNAQKFLIPKDVVLQYAGSIGYLSAGAGYELFGNKRGNLDIIYGFVPESKGGALHIFTAKFAYRPFVIRIGDWAKVYPVNPGLFIRYTLNNNLGFNFDTVQYPKGYYYFSEAARPHLSISNEFQLIKGKVLDRTGLKAISIYSEFNTNDYYLVNYFQNTSALSVTDIFKLGIGIRVKL